MTASNEATSGHGVQVVRPQDAQKLTLPGRTSWEIVSGARGASGVTLRRVEIPVAQAGDTTRGMHLHSGFEECIYVLSGQGRTESEHGACDVQTGDTVLVAAGVMHATRNTGAEPLVLLCFFPVGDIRNGTTERAAPPPHSD